MNKLRKGAKNFSPIDKHKEYGESRNKAPIEREVPIFLVKQNTYFMTRHDNDILMDRIEEFENTNATRSTKHASMEPLFCLKSNYGKETKPLLL